MNEIGLDASAVGNHEFDKGWADLRDRVIGPPASRNAKWDYLGANVYKKGTTTPVLPEYATYTVDGVTRRRHRCGHPGDAEPGQPRRHHRPRLRRPRRRGQPGGRAAQRRQRRQRRGRRPGGHVPRRLQRHHELRRRLRRAAGEFADMANLDPNIDAIFNGHTHQKYVFNQPVTGGDLPTRPIVQTGSVRRERRPDPARPTTPDTGKVTGNAAQQHRPRDHQRRRPDRQPDVRRGPAAGQEHRRRGPGQRQGRRVTSRSARSRATSPRRSRAAPTSTASTPAVPGTTAGSESALGDLVADALRDGIPAAQGKADLGIVNPGGLRDELLYAGSTATNPANTDGTVTYAEANAVLPFVNNIWLVQLTGKQLKSVLEQQWQPAGAAAPVPRAGALRQRPGHPGRQQARRQPDHRRAGQRRPAGQRRRPTRSARSRSSAPVATTSRRSRTARPRTPAWSTATCGSATSRAPAPSRPTSPASRSQAKNMKRSVKPNKKYHFTVSGLDLTSLGSPQNTEVGVYAHRRGEEQAGAGQAGRVPGDATGVAKVNFRTPDIRFSQLSVVAEPSDTTVGIFHGTFNHQIKAKPRLATSKAPKPALVGKTRTVVEHRGEGPGHGPQGLGRGQDRWQAVQGQARRRQGRRSSCRSSTTPARRSSRSSTSATTSSSAPTSSSTSGSSAAERQSAG